MKLLFVHGHETMKEDFKGNFYTSGSYNDKVWSIYLKVFDEIEVMFRKDSYIYKEEHAKKNFQVFKHPKMTFSQIDNYYSSIRSFFNLKLRNEINRNLEEKVKTCDYLIARLPSDVSRKAVQFAIKHKKPYLIELVGCPWNAYWFHSLKGKVLAPYNWYTNKQTLAKAKFVIYVTDKFLQARYPNLQYNIGCSDVVLKNINDEILENRLEKIKRRFFKEDQSFTVGTIGPVDVKYKGQEFVIRAISELKKEGHNINYQIVGGGNNIRLRKVAENLNVLENITFLSNMPHENIFGYLDNIDLYIQPSLTEGLPRAVIESLSRACPSIGTNVGGIPELVSDKNVFAAKDVLKIKKMIKMYKEDYELNTKESIKAYRISKKYENKVLENKKINFLLFFKEKGMENK